jgi:hypothetical protein
VVVVNGRFVVNIDDIDIAIDDTGNGVWAVIS